MSSSDGSTVKLTVPEAAARLGVSPKTVRRMLVSGVLPGQKVGGRWLIDASDLAPSSKQGEASDRKDRQLRMAVEGGLGLSGKERKPRYSIRDLKAFQIALPLYHKAAEHLGAEHRATTRLEGVLEYLVEGCHRYDYSEKAQSYQAARDKASRVISALTVAPNSTAAGEIITAIEQDLMAAIAGLLRRLDRKRLR